jgi:hypothetical protein
LTNADTDPERLQWDAAPEIPVVRDHWRACLRCDGVSRERRGQRTSYDEYRPKGVIHPNGALETKPWGAKEFTVCEPA